MTVSAVNQSYYQSPASASSSATGTTGMTETGFLQLLVAQLKNQSPDSPQDPSQFAAQLAQFSTVEELQNLNRNVQGFNQATELGEAAALIGKTVTVDLGNNQTDSGAVEKVLYGTGAPQLVINGNSYDFGAIAEID